MEVFRVARARYAADLSGKGCEPVWRPMELPRNAVVYAAEHRSLVVLADVRLSTVPGSGRGRR